MSIASIFNVKISICIHIIYYFSLLQTIIGYYLEFVLWTDLSQQENGLK